MKQPLYLDQIIMLYIKKAFLYLLDLGNNNYLTIPKLVFVLYLSYIFVDPIELWDHLKWAGLNLHIIYTDIFNYTIDRIEDFADWLDAWVRN